MEVKVIIAAATAVAILSACAKEQESSPIGAEKDLCFSVLNENSKTSLSGTSVLWSEGDCISVFSGSANQKFENPVLGEGNASASFSGTAVAADTYYALYPYDAEASISGGIITTTLPAEQSFTASSFGNGANIAVAVTSTQNLIMKNVGAYVSFTVNQEGVTSVTLSSSNYLAGSIRIDAGKDSPTVETVEGQGVKSIRLSGNFVAGSKYYFVVLPGTHENLTMTMTTAGGDITFSNDAPLTLDRRDNIALGTIAAKLPAPTGITFNQESFTSNRQKTLLNNISWNPVNGATGYIVQAGSTSLTAEGTTAMLGVLEGDLTVTVQAVNEDYPELFLASETASKDISVKYYGAGTSAHPWRIYDAGDWEEFCADAAGYFYTGKFVSVMQDIDFNNASVPHAGVSTSKSFAGTFDGGEHTFSNLTIGDGTTLTGLFWGLSGTVKNLIIDHATATAPTTGTTKCGVLCGMDTSGSIENVRINNSSITCSNYGAMIVGCLAGANSVVKGCKVVNCTITSSLDNNGAIAGLVNNTGKIVDCSVKGCTISGRGATGAVVGGLNVANSYVINCISRDNDITATGQGMGGLVGMVYAAAHIVNNLSSGNTIRNTTRTSEALMSLLLGQEKATAGKVQNNVVSSGSIYHACTTKPRIGFFVGTKESGAWNINYYNIDLVTSANKSTADNLGPIGNTAFAGATTGGSTSVGEGGTVSLNDLVSRLNANISSQNYVSDFPEIRTWIAGSDGWPTFEYETQE